ncbi:MAG: hypothetical protein AAFX81_11305 [Pseudomonadota bacterium]
MSAAPLGHGVYWGLRRLANDAGGFVLLDLSGADADVLPDLMAGLAPFATGIVVDQGLALDLWRRHGSTLLGRCDIADSGATILEARANGADAVLASSPLSAATMRATIARIGADSTADVALVRRTGGPWLVRTLGEADDLGDAAGYWVDSVFWRGAIVGGPEARRRLIADRLVPALQQLNAAVIDLPRAAWLDA